MVSHSKELRKRERERENQLVRHNFIRYLQIYTSIYLWAGLCHCYTLTIFFYQKLDIYIQLLSLLSLSHSVNTDHKKKENTLALQPQPILSVTTYKKNQKKGISFSRVQTLERANTLGLPPTLSLHSYNPLSLSLSLSIYSDKLSAGISLSSDKLSNRIYCHHKVIMHLIMLFMIYFLSYAHFSL